MRNFFRPAALPLALALTAGCAMQSTENETVKNLSIYEEQISFVYSDAEITIAIPPVDTPFTAHGDTFYVNNRLLNGDPRDGQAEEIGVVRRACVRVESTPLVDEPKDPFKDQQRDSLCTMTFTLNGRGQIVAEGAMDENRFERGETSTMAITGGTGEFIGAKGEVTMVVEILPNQLLRTDIKLLMP